MFFIIKGIEFCQNSFLVSTEVILWLLFLMHG